MKMPDVLPEKMYAPCGINCTVCYVHLRKKNACLGCWAQDLTKPEHCRKCKIKSCAAEQGVGSCAKCSTFPCPLIMRLDKSYRQRYQVSLIADAIRRKGDVQEAMREERDTWTCRSCSGIISLHDRVCSECGRRYPFEDSATLLKD